MTDFVRERVSETLGIPYYGQWSVLDQKGNLVLVHYVENEGAVACPGIRGVIVDVERKFPVACSFPYTPVETYETTSMVARGYNYYMGIEGTILRIFKHDGVIYISTHKKISAVRSRWGSSKTFTEMYNTYGGPNPESLFDPECKYSMYCYVFMVCDHTVMVSSKLDTKGKGFVMYLGARKMFTIDENGGYYNKKLIFTKEEIPIIDTKLRYVKTRELFEYLLSSDTKAVVGPVQLSESDAIDHIKYGFTKNGIGTGEFIILSDGFIEESKSLCKIASRDYLRRVDIRGGDPNTYHRYYVLKDMPKPKINPSLDLFRGLPDEVLSHIQDNGADFEYVLLLSALPPSLIIREYKINERFATDIRQTAETFVRMQTTPDEIPYFARGIHSVEKMSEILKRTVMQNLYSIIMQLKK